MKYLETPEEKKSFAITSTVFVLLFLVFIFFGLTYMDPPPENGIAVNFGTSDVGAGEVQPTEPVASQTPTQTEPTPAAPQETLTQEIDDSPVVVTPKKTTKKPEKPTEEKPKKPVEQVKQPSKATTNALNNILNSKSQDGKQGGEGEGAAPGDQGKQNGDLYATSYFGNGSGNSGGSGKGTGWGLNGRKLASNSKKVQDCNEQGKVVVKIWVNQQGRVIKAERAQGTTNTNPCLVNPALETAKSFRWQPDANAPETQIGFVVIDFKLGE